LVLLHDYSSHTITEAIYLTYLIQWYTDIIEKANLHLRKAITQLPIHHLLHNTISTVSLIAMQLVVPIGEVNLYWQRCN